MSKPTVNILCTSVGNPAFPTIVSELRRSADHDFRIIGTDIRKEAPGLYLTDKSYLVSRLTEPHFINEIFSLIETEKIDTLMPISTIDQNFFSINKKRIEERGVKVLVSDPEAVLIANNKYNLYDFLKLKNINPLHYSRITTETAPQLVKEYGEPFVLKNEEGAGGQGTYIVSATDTDLREDDRKFFLSTPNFLANPGAYISKVTVITEYLPGDEFSVDTLSYKGKFFYAVIRKRFKSVGGLALESTVVENNDIIELSERIVREIKLSYINNLQFKVSSTGSYKLMEINPRIPGTIKLSLAAGADMILDSMRLVDGATHIDTPNLAFGTSIYRYWDGVIATPEAINAITNLNVQHV
jgi:carbamoyl-phosphate synthase large subunit